MNRRNARFFILGTLSLSVVGVFVGREMASWRPVEVARFAPYAASDDPLRASNRFVSLSTYVQKPRLVTSHNCFDVEQRKMLVLQFQGEYATGADSNFLWNIRMKGGIYLGKPSLSALEVSEPSHPNKKRAFKFMVNGFTHHSPEVLVLPKQNRVVLLSQRYVYEWNFQTARLQHQSETILSWDRTLSPDARTFILAGSTCIQFGDVTKGTIRRTVYFKDLKSSENVRLSPHGRFALIPGLKTLTPFSVVSTATGRTIWTVSSATINVWTCVIPEDERTIFVRSNKEWQVRDLKTGALLHRLPLIPGTSAAAASPDGATLYSVANGVLYKQRAQ